MSIAVTVTKVVTGAVVAVGVSEIVKAIVDNNTKPETKVDKVLITAGRWGLSSFVADMTANHTEAKIEAVAAFLSKTFTK